MNSTNDNNKESKFYIGGFGFVSTEEAKKLLQRIVPLARTYQTAYKIRKFDIPKEAKDARLYMEGLAEDLADNIVVQLLSFAGRDPNDVNPDCDIDK